MDPNFAAVSAVDQLGRFGGVLLDLLSYGVFLWATLKVVFDTTLYQKYLGKHPGEGKTWLQAFDLRPWISMAFGIGLAVTLNKNFAFYIEGLTDQDFFAAVQMGADLGIWTVFPAGFTVLFCQIITGMAIGGGPKVFLLMARTFAEYRQKIVEALVAKKVNGGNGG